MTFLPAFTPRLAVGKTTFAHLQSSSAGLEQISPAPKRELTGLRSDLQPKHPVVARQAVLGFQVHGVLEGRVSDLEEIELVGEVGRPWFFLCMDSRMQKMFTLLRPSYRVSMPRNARSARAPLGAQTSEFGQVQCRPTYISKFYGLENDGEATRSSINHGLESVSSRHGSYSCQKPRGGLHHQAGSYDASSRHQRLAIAPQKLQQTARPNRTLHANSCGMHSSQARSQILH